MARLLLSTVVLLEVISGGCRGRDDLDGRRRPIPGLEDRGSEYALLPEDTDVVLDLLDNRAALVVHGGGALTIECGTADFAKYVEGAYRSHWHLAADDSGKRAALFDGLAGELYLPLDRDVGGVARDADGSIHISMWARAAREHQLVSVFLNEKRLGDISMPTTDWRAYSIRAPAATVREGENKLRLYFRHTGQLDGQRTAAAVGRIRVGASGAVQNPVVRSESVTRGQKRLSALRVGQASRLSYYVQVPSGHPSLLFAAAGSNTQVSVAVASSGTAASPAWEGTATEEWKPTLVELSAWSGEVVRIDLLSRGPVDWGRPQLVMRKSERAAPKPVHPPADHVVVWVVSALRADRVGGKVPTPGFERLAERGIRFISAHSAAPVPAAAHVAMLSGKHPQGGVISKNTQTLGERFGEAGYTTALISGNGFVNDEAGFADGFAVYRNPMRLRHPFRARFLWQKARRLLQKHKDGRTFIYIVTVEPHLPYTPTAESLAAEWDRGAMRFTPAETIALSDEVLSGRQHLSKEEEAYIEALYDAEVRDADAAFANMMTDLEELGIADRTAVILVGDHGEELWERGAFGHGTHLHQEVLHVPLVIAPPRMASPVVVERDVSLVDLYATALDLAGITANSENQGTTMLAPRQSVLAHPIFAHLPRLGRSLKLGRYKLVVPLRGGHQLYDLVRDPGEESNLMDARPLIERYMRNVFGIGVAYQSAWSRERWGRANNVSPAFAADHGL